MPTKIFQLAKIDDDVDVLQERCVTIKRSLEDDRCTKKNASPLRGSQHADFTRHECRTLIYRIKGLIEDDYVEMTHTHAFYGLLCVSATKTSSCFSSGLALSAHDVRTAVHTNTRRPVTLVLVC